MKFHRLIFQIILISLSLLPFSDANAQVESPISMSVFPGLENNCKANHYFPVTIILENSGPDIEATIEIVQDRNGEDTTTTSSPITLANGARKAIQFVMFTEFYPHFDQQVTVSDNEGNVLIQQSHTLDCLEYNGHIVGILAERRSTFYQLEQIPGLGSAVQVAQLEPDYFPSNSLGLSPMGSLVISDYDSSQLSDQQIEAIHQWVSNGGQLVLTGGSGWFRTSAPFQDMLPISNVELSTLPGIEFSNEPLPEETTVITGDLNVDTSTLIWSGSSPLVIERQIGYGKVTVLLFDPSQPPARGWPGINSLFQSFLDTSSISPSWQNGFVSWEAVNQAAGFFESLQLPSIYLFCGFLLAYVLLIGPANYLILKKIKKGDLAWVTIPSLIILFTATTIITGRAIRGSDIILNEINLIQVWPERAQARVDTALSIFSPYRKTYQINFPPNSILHAIPLYYGISRGDWHFQYTGEQSSIQDLRMETSQINSLNVTSWVTAPLIESDLSIYSSEQGMHLTGSIQNLTGFDLSDIVLLHPAGLAVLGDFQNGTILEIDVILGNQAVKQDCMNITPVTSLSVPVTSPNISCFYDIPINILGGNYSFEDSENYIRFNILQSILNSYYVPGDMGLGFHLFGWTDISPIQFDVPGTSPKEQETSLYIFYLSTPYNVTNGKITIPPSAFAWKNWEDDYSYSSPYDITIESRQESTFTYKLQYPTPFQYVTNLGLGANSPIPLQTAGLEFYIWNFSQHDWVLIDVRKWGQTSIENADEFVNAKGEIILKISNNTQQNVRLTQIDFTLTVER